MLENKWKETPLPYIKDRKEQDKNQEITIFYIYSKDLKEKKNPLGAC